MNPTNDPSGDDLRWRPTPDAAAASGSVPSYPTDLPPAFQPQPAPAPVAPSPSQRRGSGRGLSSRLIGGAVIVAAVFAAGGFGAGYVVASNGTPSPNPGAVAGANGNGFAGFNGGQGGQGVGNGARAAFGNGAAGTIASVSSTQLTLTTQGNGSRIVLLTPQTTITKVTSTTVTTGDLKSGDTVTVRGTANPDGSITAEAVILGADGLFGGRGFGFGPRGSAAPSPSTAP